MKLQIIITVHPLHHFQTSFPHRVFFQPGPKPQKKPFMDLALSSNGFIHKSLRLSVSELKISEGNYRSYSE
jgi:hypothetical protein